MLRFSITAVLALVTTSLTYGDVIREQSADEERALKMSSHFFASEIARDYSEFVGKTLSEIGVREELIVQREPTPGAKACARPDDVVIQSAITDLVLLPFPATASHKDYREGRHVTGTLKDGRGFAMLFCDGSPIEVSIEINRETNVRFAFRKKGPIG